LPPDADNPSYTTASAQECKCGHYSLPLYRKQEKSLFTAALEQTSNVSTARDVSRSSGRVRRRACRFPIPIPGVLSAIAFPHRVPSHGAADPVSARRFTRPSSRNVDRLFSGDSAAHRLGADGRCASPSRFAMFGCATAGYVDRPQAEMGSRHRPGTAPEAGQRSPPFMPPAGYPTPIMLVKGTFYSGEIRSLD